MVFLNAVAARSAGGAAGKAKAHAPCIVFMDELDAVGWQRGWPMTESNADARALVPRMMCVARNCVSVRKMGGRSVDAYILREDLMQFFKNSIPLSSAIYQIAGLTPGRGRRRLAAVAKYLRLL